ncbi:hypothetical protein [Lentzea roselyniae]|uniref:hypothetical protein n=1 Tax=Lentzea roselyniae TaxID=531940 RepID=UPI0031F9268E
MPAPAADQTRRVAWLAGVACLACCLVPVLGVAGATGALAAIGVEHVLVGLGVAAVAVALTWMVVRRRHRCAGGRCRCAVPR